LQIASEHPILQT